jgi:hypothetical protein
MIRRAFILAMAIAVFGLTAGPAWATPSDAAGAFRDDDGSVHEPNINAIKAAGITSGCNPPQNDRFCPRRGLTRAELASLFVRALDLPPAPPSGFRDVAGSVHAANIDALAASGITKGCNPPSNTLFCPDRITTRAEMASFLVRALNLPPAVRQPFIDVSGSVHADNVAALAASGITTGCNPPANDRYCPRDQVTREQIATFLTRALPELSPIYNELGLDAFIFCAKDGFTCRRSFTANDGIIWRTTGGWYNAIPFFPGEQSVFNASNTRLEIKVDGVAVPPSELPPTLTSLVVNRLFTAVLPPLARGTHTIVVRWRWDGKVVRTLTFTVTGT